MGSFPEIDIDPKDPCRKHKGDTLEKTALFSSNGFSVVSFRDLIKSHFSRRIRNKFWFGGIYVDAHKELQIYFIQSNPSETTNEYSESNDTNKVVVLPSNLLESILGVGMSSSRFSKMAL